MTRYIVSIILAFAVCAVFSLDHKILNIDGFQPEYDLVSEPREFLGQREPLSIPQGYTPLYESKVDKNQKIRLIIALKQKNLDKLDSIFWDVSNPKSENYGKYLTIDELTELVAPESETIEMVQRWLDQHDVSERTMTLNQDFIHINVPIWKAEQLLHTQFSSFRHDESGKVFVRSLGPYSTPKSVHPHVDFVIGSLGFNKIHKVSVKREKSDLVGDVIPITPQILRQRYQVPASAIGKNKKNSQAVAEFQYEYYSPTDLQQFFKQFVNVGGASYNDTVAKVVGYNNNDNPGTEANLDIQYIMGVAPNVPTWFYSNPSIDFWSDLTAWINQISNDPNAPWVHSISYGDQGEGPAGAYKDRLNTEFQKIGARGISFIFASGDSGTGCEMCYYFKPSFPATSPYVTAVGATRFIGTTTNSEEAVKEFGSGGGMSWHFPIPSYQKAAVDHYFSTQTDLPDSFFYNRNGRGTPDIAALGIGFQVVDDGEVISVGGTSASAPTAAGIISLLNEIRLNNNKPTLGFLNQWIYQTWTSNPSAFYDVTSGNNQDGCCGYTGFQCAPGWDPVTGLGTINYAVLSKYL